MNRFEITSHAKMPPLKLHIISGLPRSGSTLLAAILRQNPDIYATIETPMADLVAGLVRDMSGHEGSIFITEGQRERMLRSLLEAYYKDVRNKLVFDANRRWCALLPIISRLFPAARVICCVRSPAWIIDSIERAVHRNPFMATRIFGHEVSNVYARVEKLLKDHLIAPSRTTHVLSAYKKGRAPANFSAILTEK